MYKTCRTDLYTKHLFLQHPKRWAEYQTLLSDAAREAFFKTGTVPYANTMDAHYGVAGELSFSIGASIVEDIIGGMLFHPDDVSGVAYEHALSLFKKQESGDYIATIKSSKMFSMLLGNVALGCTFRLAAKIVQHVRDETLLNVYSGCTDTLAANYARVACAASLQMIRDGLNQVTGFSLALDSSTLQGTSSLDVRARMAWAGELYNFHLIALPLYESHTSERLCDTLFEFLDARHPSWRALLVGVSTDGEPKTTGRVRGMVTRIEMATPTQKIIRGWCGLHQLDLVMQRIHTSSLDDTFLSTLNGSIGHLRRQQKLIAEMRATCPNYATTRWLSMVNCTRFFTKHSQEIQEHYDTNGVFSSRD